MTRERDRYGRQGFAEIFGEIPGWFRAHPTATRIAAVLVLLFVIWRLLEPRYGRFEALAAGDCLYLPGGSVSAPSQREATTLIADARDGIPIADAVELTSCGGSHTHEVSAVFPLGAKTDPFPGVAEMDRTFRPGCGAVTLFIVPSENGWRRGDRQGVCLDESTAQPTLPGST